MGYERGLSVCALVCERMPMCVLVKYWRTKIQIKGEVSGAFHFTNVNSLHNLS